MKNQRQAFLWRKRNSLVLLVQLEVVPFKTQVSSTNSEPIKIKNTERTSSIVTIHSLTLFLASLEVVMMSCKVVKFNKYNWAQDRSLIITQDNIYNFK